MGDFEIANSAQIGLACKVEQGWSKLSRFWMVKMRPKYVKTSIAQRQGECGRCALCCKVFFKCPFLKDTGCQIYEKRFHQCRAFPINRRDVNLITKMGGKCGFRFDEEQV